MTATRMSADQTLALWRRYKQTGDTKLRERLVLTLAPLVRYIVFKKIREVPAHCEVEDFISCGLEALIRSIDRYDPGKGATLEQFAWTRIHGAVLDELRRNDWAPRSLRRWERDAQHAREQFQLLHGRQPHRAELSEALGTTVEELRRREQDLYRADVGSLNTLVLGDDDSTIETIDTLQSTDRDTDPEDSAVRARAAEQLGSALEGLPERELQIAVLMYVHNLTLREIGDVVGVTESRVCQIHSGIKRRLRQQLEAHELLFAAVA
jgi:RNA polymerase sigma factor for flagellar operon FliA